MPQLIRRIGTGDFRRGPGVPRLDLQPYRGFLEDLTLGEGGILELEEGETQRVVKRRLSMAAAEQGASIKWRTAPAGQLRFQLIKPTKEPVEATPPPGLAPAPVRARSRPKKATQAAS
jgi:hypothetical protein